MTTVSFRRAGPTDAEAVAHVYLTSRKTFVSFAPLIHSDDDVFRWISGTLIPSGNVTVATLDGEVVGMMSLSREGAVGWIDHLYIHPTAIGHGIGTCMVDLAKAQLGHTIRLHTFQENMRARQFYERHGFRALKFRDGTANEEKCPDVLYEWTTHCTVAIR